MENLLLDINAHKNMSQKTLDSYISFNNSIAGHGHPSSPSVPGRAAADALEQARAKIAELIGAQNPNQIIFTNGCSQACSWSLKILLNNTITGNYAMSPVEHPAVDQTFSELHKQKYGNTKYSKLPIDDNGLILVNNITPNINYDLYDESEVFAGSIICIHMQNETGVINSIQDLDCDYLIFSDMSQSLGKIPVNVTDLDIDIAVFGAHKFGGPPGFGFMYLKDTNNWMEFGHGSRYFTDITGTPSVINAVTTAVALEEAIKTLPQRTQNMILFQRTLEAGLKELGFEIIGEKAPRSPNTSFVKVPDKWCGYPDENPGNQALMLLMELGDMGHVNCFSGLGSACGSMHTSGSKLIQTLGRQSKGLDHLRISTWGDYAIEEAEFLLTRIQNSKAFKGKY